MPPTKFQSFRVQTDN